jgi:hypothetical protein
VKRTVVISLSVLVLLGAAVTVALVKNDDRAPMPSEDELRTKGFAVWPEDTLDEGMDSCEHAQAWQLDPQETAFRFAREVLKYPDPQMNTDPVSQSTTQIRYLMGSNGVRGDGVFLGAVIDVKKYDRCWFIVNAEDREDAAFDEVSYRHQGGRIWLVVHHRGLIETEVGYGAWERRSVPLASRGIAPAPPQPGAESSFRLPRLDPDATGHIMSLTRNERGIAIGIAARPLGFVPAQ